MPPQDHCFVNLKDTTAENKSGRITENAEIPALFNPDIFFRILKLNWKKQQD